MSSGEKILWAFMVGAGAGLLYLCGEIALRVIQEARGKPPETIGRNMETPRGRRFYWAPFGGMHPGVWFEIYTDEDLEGNFERFENWVYDRWVKDGEGPDDEWWGEAYEVMEAVHAKALQIREDAEVEEFRKSLESL